MGGLLSNEEEPASSGYPAEKAEATQKEVTPIEFTPMQRKVGSKLRILALHGHAQSAEGFRKKFGSIRGQCKKYVGDWVYPQGPYKVPHCAHSLENNPDEETYSWLNLSREERKKREKEDTWEDQGGIESLKLIAECIQKDGPFDGIFGFSMGSGIAAVFLTHPAFAQARANIRFAIFFAGFLPPHPDDEKALREATFPDIATFHGYGLSDEIIVPDRSKDLLSLCDQSKATIYEHPGGHFMSSDARKPLADFLKVVYEQIQEEEQSQA